MFYIIWYKNERKYLSRWSVFIVVIILLYVPWIPKYSLVFRIRVKIIIYGFFLSPFAYRYNLCDDNLSVYTSVVRIYIAQCDSEVVKLLKKKQRISYKNKSLNMAQSSLNSQISWTHLTYDIVNIHFKFVQFFIDLLTFHGR